MRMLIKLCYRRSLVNINVVGKWHGEVELKTIDVGKLLHGS